MKISVIYGSCTVCLKFAKINFFFQYGATLKGDAKWKKTKKNPSILAIEVIVQSLDRIFPFLVYYGNQDFVTVLVSQETV